MVVNNTAAATLRQLVIFAFDKVAIEDNSLVVAAENGGELDGIRSWEALEWVRIGDTHSKYKGV